MDIDATKSSVILGLNRNTINRYYGIFDGIYQKQVSDKQLFFGEIELDEAYFGSKGLRGINMPQKRGRGTCKQSVFGVFERNTRVYTEIVPNAKQAALKKVIRGKIDASSVLFTDGWRGCNGLLDMGYNKHFRMDKTKVFLTDMGITSTELKVSDRKDSYLVHLDGLNFSRVGFSTA